MNNQNMLIKYQHQSDSDTKGFDLALLGGSFIGLNTVFKEFFEISGLEGELVVNTTKISEGSIDVHNLIQIIGLIPFKEIKDLLDFLQVVDIELYKQATNFFQEIGQAHRTVNDWYKDNPLDLEVTTILLTIFFTKMFRYTGVNSKNSAAEMVDENGKTIPEKFSKKLRQMVKKGAYKRFVKPITENNVSKISVMAANKSKSYVATVDETNLENFLPEEEEILPELKNGDIKNFTGEIRNLESTRGERVKIRINEVDSQYQLFTARPADGQDTEDYKEFYKKMVSVKAEVLRASMYKRPELILHSVEKMEQELFDGYQNN